MGIKRTNANTLDSINVEGGVALYATYTLVSISPISLYGITVPKTRPLYHLKKIALRSLRVYLFGTVGLKMDSETDSR